MREVEDAFRRGRARASRKRFRLAHYSIQGHHLHAIVEAEGTDALGRGMMSVGIRFARAVNRALPGCCERDGAGAGCSIQETS